MNDEPQLIQKARNGDSTAFGQLVASYQDRLFTSMVHVVGGPEEAEDVVQDAFVQAYLKLDSFDGRSTFFTWLYRIAFHKAMNRQRSRRVEISLTPSGEPSGVDPPDHGELPDARLLRQERAVQIQSALARLSEEYRTVMILREMEDLDYEAIANILDISVGTVRSRLHRARSLLRSHLRQIRTEVDR